MGPYDNEREIHLSSPEYDDGQWLVDEHGSLYIVPTGGDQVDGPENETSDGILAALRAQRADRIDLDTMLRLGLTPVDAVLHRFDAITGYYVA